MIRVRIISKGEVQKVGYRDYIEKIARELNLTGYVENLRGGDVQTVCEGEEIVIEKFVKLLKIEKGFIKVKSVDIIEKSQATGEFEYFEIKRGKPEDEIGERLDMAVLYLDATKNELKEEMNKGFSEVKHAVSEVKDAVSEVKDAVSEVKDAVSDVKHAVEAHHASTDKYFQEIITRYDVFGTSMKMLVERMDKVENTMAKIEQTLELLVKVIAGKKEKDEPLI